MTDKDRKLAEKILEDGINDGRYATILDTINPDMNSYYLRQIIEYAEAYHEAKLEEELFNYSVWFQETAFKCHALDESIRHGVDEYLKQKK